MKSAFLDALDLSSLTPVRIWMAMSAEARGNSARAFFAQAAKDDPLRLVIDTTIARNLRFRPESVKKMPVDKKAGYLVRLVHPDENLAAGLLQALHLEAQRPLLSAFLDQVGVAHDNGHIDAAIKLEAPSADKLRAAADKAYATFPPEEVDVYLATLVVFDPDTWIGLHAILERRKKA